MVRHGSSQAVELKLRCSTSVKSFEAVVPLVQDGPVDCSVALLEVTESRNLLVATS